ncbi:MAG: hypothetical protein H6702_12150 [Myxococcales bacterium]|nr:hypothetical protein [Myxococcales bacterium]
MIQVPGKLILLGEYAVLAGLPALVVAVDRYATCTVSPGAHPIIEGVGLGRFRPGDGGHELPFARAVLARGPAPAPAHYRIDTRAFGDSDAPGGWTKMGLGSSAASTVALARAVDPTAPPATIYGRAQAAHRQVQGTGSGADVAASAFGGAFRYRWLAGAAGPLPAGDGAGEVHPLGQGPGEVWAVWTGAAASTPGLVGRVKAWAAADPAGLRARHAALAAAAEQGCVAWQANDRAGLVAAARAGFAALDALAGASGAPLVLPAHRTLAALAGAHGGACKPTGAGGGDLAWRVGPDGETEARLAQAAAAAGFRAWRFEVAPAP